MAALEDVAAAGATVATTAAAAGGAAGGAALPLARAGMKGAVNVSCILRTCHVCICMYARVGGYTRRR